MQHPSVVPWTFLRWEGIDWHRMGTWQSCKFSRVSWQDFQKHRELELCRVKTEWWGRRVTQESPAPFLLLSLANSLLLLSHFQCFFVRVILWWSLPSSGALPSPALSGHCPSSQCPWDLSSAECLQAEILVLSFLLEVCVWECPGSLT